MRTASRDRKHAQECQVFAHQMPVVCSVSSFWDDKTLGGMART
jgi:hypothetical protein